jgi:Mrp family chromosome partitioning ATPase
MAGVWQAMLGILRSHRDESEGRGTASQLALRLDRELANDHRACTIYIAGADDDRSGAEACAELGLSLAEEYGRSVLIVDATFSQQGIGAMLGNSAAPGLVDMLETETFDTHQLRTLCQPTVNELVTWLPAGQRSNGHIASVSSKRLRAFLDVASETTDFVLVQGANVISGGRSLAFVSLCDAALMVVLEGKTRVERIEQARDILLDCGGSRVGLVLAG